MNHNTLVPLDQRVHATGQAGAGSSSLIGAAPCADEAATSMAVPPGGPRILVKALCGGCVGSALTARRAGLRHEAIRERIAEMAERQRRGRSLAVAAVPRCQRPMVGEGHQEALGHRPRQSADSAHAQGVRRTGPQAIRGTRGEEIGNARISRGPVRAAGSLLRGSRSGIREMPDRRRSRPRQRGLHNSDGRQP